MFNVKWPKTCCYLLLLSLFSWKLSLNSFFMCRIDLRRSPQESIAKEKKWDKKCLEICVIKGGGGGGATPNGKNHLKFLFWLFDNLPLVQIALNWAVVSMLGIFLHTCFLWWIESYMYEINITLGPIWKSQCIVSLSSLLLAVYPCPCVCVYNCICKRRTILSHFLKGEVISV